MSATKADRPLWTCEAFTVVPMIQNHLDEVLAIERKSFTNPWSKRDFEYGLRDEQCLSVVALLDGKVISYGVGYFVFVEFHLANLAVAPSLRRQGFGKRLLRWILERSSKRDAQVITLEVRASNTAAIQLYRKLGFRQVALRRNYYSRPREDAIVMVKSIGACETDWIKSLKLLRF